MNLTLIESSQVNHQIIPAQLHKTAVVKPLREEKKKEIMKK